MIVITLYITHDRRTKIVFCRVSEGDATYIRTSNAVDILIDAGTGTAVNTCLGKHMPFYDRKIEYVILTHVKKSQYDGFGPVLGRYSIGSFLTSEPGATTASFVKLLSRLKRKGVPISSPVADSRIHIDTNVYIRALGPSSVLPAGARPNISYAYTFEFVINFERILFVGSPAAVEAALGTKISENFYSIIKYAEYGFGKVPIAHFSGLAEKSVLLISVPKKKAQDKQTEDLFNDKVIRVGSGDDIVYRF